MYVIVRESSYNDGYSFTKDEKVVFGPASYSECTWKAENLQYNRDYGAGPGDTRPYVKYTIRKVKDIIYE